MDIRLYLHIAEKEIPHVFCFYCNTMRYRKKGVDYTGSRSNIGRLFILY